MEDKTKELSLYEKLSIQVPEKYLIKYEDEGKTFTGYNAQYAINLLNEVIGLGKWKVRTKILKEEVTSKGWAIATKCVISIDEIHVEGFGGAYAKKIENAYKGAKTSAFKNACRYLGIGKELYNNEMDDDIITYEAVKEETASTSVAIPQEIVDLEQKIEECKTIQQLQSLEDKVKAVKEKSVQGIIIKKYNNKKIALIK